MRRTMDTFFISSNITANNMPSHVPTSSISQHDKESQQGFYRPNQGSRISTTKQESMSSIDSQRMQWINKKILKVKQSITQDSQRRSISNSPIAEKERRKPRATQTQRDVIFMFNNMYPQMGNSR